MSLTIVRDAGAYGFDTTPITGTGLSAAAVVTQRAELEQARLLADALGRAITQARAQGVAGFKGADLGPLLPPGLSGADSSPAGQLREQLFSQRLGIAYAGAPATLEQWSRALDALQQWIGATTSRLPPGQGGGTCCVQGSWYVNGEPYSLAELFTANRVNTFAEIDTQLAAGLNVIAANSVATKALTGLMRKLFEKYYDMGSTDTASKSQINTLGESDADYPISFSQLLACAKKYISEGSWIAKLDTISTWWWFLPEVGLIKEDFRAMIDEVEKIIAAKAQDNQIAQMRNQTLMDSRANLLDGLSGFLKGQQSTRSAVSRNL